MATYVPAKRATAYIEYVHLQSASDPNSFQANPTLASGDVKVSIDGGAFANLTTLPTVTPASGRAVKVELSASEMTGDVIVVEFVDQTSPKEWADFALVIPTAARQIDDLAYPATSGRSMVVDAAGLVDANTVKVGPTGSGTAQTAGDIIGDTNDIQTRLPAALVSGRIDASVGAMAANVMTAAAAAADLTTELQSGLATAAALATAQTSIDDIPTNAELATALGTADDAVLAQVALVKAQTDLIPSDPADASVIAARFDTLDTNIADLPTNAELATALGTADDAVLAQVALVKAKTDSLTFTVAGVLDANTKYVAGTAVTGAGTEADPWGPT